MYVFKKFNALLYNVHKKGLILAMKIREYIYLELFVHKIFQSDFLICYLKKKHFQIVRKNTSLWPCYHRKVYCDIIDHNTDIIPSYSPALIAPSSRVTLSPPPPPAPSPPTPLQQFNPEPRASSLTPSLVFCGRSFEQHTA